jgi:hypothetical protein
VLTGGSVLRLDLAKLFQTIDSQFLILLLEVRIVCSASKRHANLCLVKVIQRVHTGANHSSRTFISVNAAFTAVVPSDLKSSGSARRRKHAPTFAEMIARDQSGQFPPIDLPQDIHLAGDKSHTGCWHLAPMLALRANTLAPRRYIRSSNFHFRIVDPAYIFGYAHRPARQIAPVTDVTKNTNAIPICLIAEENTIDYPKR